MEQFSNWWISQKPLIMPEITISEGIYATRLFLRTKNLIFTLDFGCFILISHFSVTQKLKTSLKTLWQFWLCDNYSLVCYLWKEGIMFSSFFAAIMKWRHDPHWSGWRYCLIHIEIYNRWNSLKKKSIICKNDL